MIGSIPRVHFLIISIAFLLVHVAMFQLYGIRNLFDALGYLNSAKGFIANGVLDGRHSFFYSLHVSLLAGFMLIFKDNVIPFLILQCLVSFMAVLFFYRSVQILTNARIALMGVLIYIFWWDHVHWNSTTMTESLFVSVSCFLFYRLSIFRGTKRDYLLMGLFLLFALLIRPTGIILVLGAVGFMIAFYWHIVRSNFKLLISLTIVFVLVSSLSAYYLLTVWDFSDQFIRGNVVTYVDIVGNSFDTTGLRIMPGNTDYIKRYDDPVFRTLMFVYYNPVEFMHAGVLKIFYLLTGYRPYYSYFHNFFTALWMLILYTGFAFGISQIENVAIKIFVIVTIVTNCLLIGVSTVDWDNRFYIPMEVVVVFVSSVGLLRIVDSTASKKKFCDR